MMKKKLTALALALAMTVGLTQGAFAAEPKNEESIEDRIQAEIQAKTEEVYDLIYEQLEAQNAVHMIDAFMDIYTPEIEFEVMQKYNMGITPYSVNAYKTFNFPNGGMVAYETLDGRKIVETYFDEDATKEYIKDNLSFTVYNILLQMIGFIPEMKPYVTGLCILHTTINTSIREDIANADDYARVTSIEDPDLGMVSAARGWYEHPMSIRYNMDTCQNLEETFFPAR